MVLWNNNLVQSVEHLARVVEEIGNRAASQEEPAFVFDLETRPGPTVVGVVDWNDKADVKFHATNPRTNEVFWMSLATTGVAWAIPMGHPHGEPVGSAPAPLRAGARTTRRTVPVFGPAPEQMSPREVIEVVRPLFMDSTIRKVNHNVKFDLLTIAKYLGKLPAAPYGDTMVQKSLLAEEPPHDLGACIRQEFGFRYDKIGGSLSAHSFREAAMYSYLDAKGTWLLWTRYLRRLREEGLEEYFWFESDVTEVLTHMEYVGAPVRDDEVDALDKFLRDEMEQIKAELWSEAGRPFELTRPRDKVWFIFEHCGHTPFMVTPKKKEISTAESHLRAFEGDSRVKRLMAFDDVKKLHSTYVENYKKFVHNGRIHTSYKQHGTRTGRFSSGEPNLQNVPKPDTEVGKRIRGLFWGGTADRCLVVGDYCLVPGTRVLGTDWVWRPVEEFREGDTVVGFPEQIGRGNGHSGHTYQPAEVVSIRHLIRPTYRVKTTAGMVEASAEHRWVAKRADGLCREWVETRHLQPGAWISYFSDPWEYEDSYESGYVAGFLDGEGWISDNGLGFGQMPGPVLDRVVSILRSRGFDVRRCSVGPTGVEKWRCYGAATTAQVLGWCRPQRLLAKEQWVGRRTWNQSVAPVQVVSVEYIGEREVVALGTSTKTFIAEGMLSHNSQIELRILAYFSGDPTMCRAFMEDVDIHQASADTLGTDRSIAKNINFAIPFGAGANKVHMMGGGKFSLRTAEKFYALHKERFPRVWAFIRQTRSECQRRPHVVYTLLGRKRRLPKISLSRSSDPNLRALGAAAERQAVNCFAEDVEAMTQRGWVRGMDLRTDDVFLTKNAETDRLEWRRAVHIWKYPEYTGPMVRVSNGRGFDVLTTPEHRWLVTSKKSGLPVVKTSEELARMSPRQSDFAVHLSGDFQQPWSQYDVDFAALLGWVLTDGYYGSTFIGITQTKERGRKEIEALLDRMGLAYNCYEPGKGRSAQYKIHGQITQHIKRLCPNKTLTYDVVNGMGDASREALFESMMAGDGYADLRSGGRGFAAGSEERADVFQYLCVLLGKTSRKYFQRYPRPAANGSAGCWQVRVQARKTAQTPHCEWIDEYTGPVWCVTVPNSFAVFRSNGMTLVSGNTRIQGSAADLIKKAMVRLFDTLDPGMDMILQVHDELVVTTPRDQAERCAALMKEAMEGDEMQILTNRDGTIRVPVRANIKIVDRWSEAK